MELGPLIEQAVDLTTRSLSLQKEGQDEEAQRLLDEALALHPLFLPALLAKVELLTRQHKYDEAMFSIRAAQAFAPHSAKLEGMRRQLGAHAKQWLQAVAPEQKENAGRLFQQGNLAMCDDNLQQAIDCFRQTLKVLPDHQAACINLGNALLAQNRTVEALECYEQVLATHHDSVNAWFNRGNALQQMNRLDEALASYAHAISLQPELPEARMETAHCLLRSGHYAEGWKWFETRWQTAQLAPLRLTSNAPQWRGPNDLRDKTLLLWAEQGLGDVIQFVRFVPEISHRARRIYLRCPTTLHRLLHSLVPHVHLIPEEEPCPPHDLQCPLMSLPLALDKTLENLNAPTAYLHAPHASGARWQTILGTPRRKRIGLCWQGHQQGIRNRTRDIPLAALQPILDLNADFVIVQKEISDADAARLSRQGNVRMPGADLGDLADTAALLENLDLVISADTMIAHLAGALGRSCHVLLRSFGEWRWLNGRNDSPWYPTLQLHRQTTLGDWTAPVTGLVKALESTLRS